MQQYCALSVLPHVYGFHHLRCVRLASTTDIHICRKTSPFQGVYRHPINTASDCAYRHGIRQAQGHHCSKEARMATQEKNAQAQLLIPQTP